MPLLMEVCRWARVRRRSCAARRQCGCADIPKPRKRITSGGRLNHWPRPISIRRQKSYGRRCALGGSPRRVSSNCRHTLDRKSTRLNSSHLVISYAVFCLKKKKINISTPITENKKKTKTNNKL